MVVEVLLFVLLVQVLFGGSHLEEVLEFSTSEWVVSIGSDVRLFHLWGLDVPEYVLWNC